MNKPVSYFLLFVLLAMTFACEPQAKITPDEARAIAKKAYIYGFPMVMAYKTMDAYILDKSNPEYKGPFNLLACSARLLTPEDKAVVTPNSDTPYCMMWADISKEPVIISVPEMEPERFYHFQLTDQYTHNFGYIGTLSTGTMAGKYMVAKVGWNGEKPEGINEIIYCETPMFFVIVRTQLFGTQDLENVKAIQAGYKVEALSEYNGGDPVPARDEINVPAWNEGDQFTVGMFKYMDALLDMIEPVATEQELMKEFARLGIGKGVTFDFDAFDSDVQQAIQEGVKEGFSDMEEFLKQMNTDPLGSSKIFGTREFLQKSARENYNLDDFYLLRACAAHLGLYGNSGFEAIYPTYLRDKDGAPFDASVNKYTLTFAEGQLPPVKSFWSLTMYDGKTQLLVENPFNRYLLNSNMMKEFVFGKDGTLTFYIQKDDPGQALQANWLPAPDGPFYCVMRLYGPKEAALSGEWKNPPLLMVP